MTGFRVAGFTALLLAISSYQVFGEVASTTPSQSVKENSSVAFVCTNNFKDPDVKWKFQDKEGSTKLIYYADKFTDDYINRATYSRTGITLKSATRKDTGEYTCDVTDRANDNYGEVKMKLIVEVKPSIPAMSVPTSVRTLDVAELQCTEKDGSPPSTFQWYKDKTLVPENPKSVPLFQNSSYTIDFKTGVLRFSPTTKSDAGEYFCEASNALGKTVSAPALLEVYDTNVGGIVAAVVIVLLILALIGVAIWFAYSRGFIGSEYSPFSQYKKCGLVGFVCV
ncbi:junctional adhesion molecule A [Ambystoma mexicanum]|uniref:junctional adhesion molecule A n=1 Tax=Ambystoma mexicanum TaxID=8296 RepID=UPI0037E93B76